MLILLSAYLYKRFHHKLKPGKFNLWFKRPQYELALQPVKSSSVTIVNIVNS